MPDQTLSHYYVAAPQHLFACCNNTVLLLLPGLQGCASDRLIDTAVMGGPKVFVVATLASSRPASPFAFRNYELPDEATPIAEQLAACAGSCKHHVWEVGAADYPPHARDGPAAHSYEEPSAYIAYIE